MWLSKLLGNLASVKNDVEFSQIKLDSRNIKKGDVFFAVAGCQQHGMQYAEVVIEQGAAAIVYDPAQEGQKLANELNFKNLIAIEGLNKKLGEIADQFYVHPTDQLNVIGITGTNGKTSCSQFLAQMMESTAVIGTLGSGLYGDLQVSNNTTPNAFDLQKLLAGFVKQYVQNVAMEVSSHGLEQGRVNVVNFTGAVFNNLSRDHLDYHGNMENYFQAKNLLFKWPSLQFVVLNADDEYSVRIKAELNAEIKVLSYSLIKGGDEDLVARNIRYTAQGISCEVLWNKQCESLNAALLGEFNLQNILAAMAVLLMQGYSLSESALAANKVQPIIGRMECFKAKNGALTVVDYAHTPDALEKVLTTLRQHCNRQLRVVFGCGGNRDVGKRAQMGCIAERLADDIIVTDDNPRFENSQSIIDAIVTDLDRQKISCIADREVAIRQAITKSEKGDIVLIAGKGHEEYQEINGIKTTFSDRALVQEIINK
ncbi:MAG: UDP-N-acetylmuramoyl-L-alanyl-D-glutamate--2,6-diaminopimelate ligase [Methyloprofundus sp.]|nr:UDP-N-acetylmuramoyl-L-alanyl-D-glutamate--2,6-diaminopimelate ligase [Methyloprofundus sp.]